jgi:ribosomal-protein-alanine N-acetyltransferase
MPEIPLDTVLHTPRCILRVISEPDIPFVWSATRFPGFNDGLRWDAPKDPDELLAATHRSLQWWASGRVFSFTVFEKATQAPVGRASIRVETRDDAWSIGYWIHPDRWGQGFALEAARALIDFGFTHLGATEIWVGHATWNHRSRRVIEKLGMRFVGEDPCGFEKNGRPIAEYKYVVTRAEAL